VKVPETLLAEIVEDGASILQGEQGVDRGDSSSKSFTEAISAKTSNACRRSLRYFVSDHNSAIFHSARDALNAYWSPLLSWAMVPWLAAGVRPLLAAKLTLLLAGAALVAGGWKLAGILTADRAVRAATTALLALLALEWCLTVVTPDLITVAILVWYLLALDRLHRSGSSRDAAFCGLLGALLYLNKAIGLPLFLVHFTLVTARPRTLRCWATGVAVCAAASAPWIVLLSWKYGALTLGTAGAHNWRLMGPQVNRFEPFWSGLFAPPSSAATSVWEDPSVVALPDWSAVAEPAHLTGLVARHARVLLVALWARSPWVPIVAIALAALVASLRDPRPRSVAVVCDALLATALVAAAALPFLVEERYVWAIPALALVLAAYLIDRLAAVWPDVAPAAIAALVASIVVPSISALQAQSATAESMQRYAAAAAALPPDLRGSRMATNPLSLERGGAPWVSWNDGLYLAWLGGLRYYGVVPPHADAAVVARELERSGIDTFVFVGAEPIPGYLVDFREVATLPTMQARVYRRGASSAVPRAERRLSPLAHDQGSRGIVPSQ
jgi:hypothetical protein